MANPPPPYDNITGISRAVMKDNSQTTLANYDGNARPGELVVNLETNPPALYIGNNAGQLTAISTGGSGGLPLSNGTSNFDIATVDGNATITVAGTQSWTFGDDGNLTVTDVGFITNPSFVGIAVTSNLVASPGGIVLQATGTDDVIRQLRFTQNGILNAPANVSVTGNVFVRTATGNLVLGTASATGSPGLNSTNSVTVVANRFGTPKEWTFGSDGGLTSPNVSSYVSASNFTATNNFQLPVYANTTVRDSSITSPTAGMMIYVTGTGMQVRGATSWNTIAGSGT